jgi:hypothetical protein
VPIGETNTEVRPGTAERGKRAKWDGCSEVGAAYCTLEVGEPTQRDPTEGRGCRMMELLEGMMAETRSSDNISTKLQRIAQLSREHRDRAFTSLAYRIDVEFLREAYRRTRKDGAVGIDGQTAQQYAEKLDTHLEDLLARLMSGRYQAPPVRRVFIPKGKGKQRPIGIPTVRVNCT